MAVVEKRRAKGRVVYGVTNLWLGRPAWELVGPNRLEAERRDREMKKEIKRKTYVPKQQQIGTTVQQFIDYWGSTRTNASANDERRSLRLYVETAEWFADMRIDDVEPMHVLKLVNELKKKKKPDGSKRLTDKTIANAIGVLRVMFEAARMAKLCKIQPVDIPRATLKRSPKVEKEIYQLSECAVLIRHHTIPWPIRVLNAMCLLTGMREGEACGRRWRDLDDAPKPLASLSVHDQYDGRPLKTERPRLVPVHSELHAILMAWAQEGFELYTGARPTPDDFIVPNVSARATLAGNHTRSSYYKAFIRYAEAAGVRPRSLHATRHSFVTHCRRAGARADVVERVTHNAAGSIVDRYTHWEWEPLCEAISLLDLDARREATPTPQIGGGTGGGFLGGISRNPHGSSVEILTDPGSIPGVSSKKSLVLQPPRKTRQEKRQDADTSGDVDLRIANRTRKRRLLALQEGNPELAQPDLYLVRALDAVYDDDLDEAERLLERAAEVVA